MSRTPNALLGRISAVNFIFIGASNELGGFEAALVVMAIALIWPEMRRLGAISPD